MEMNLKRADVQIAELNRANSIFIDKHENKTSDELKAFYNDYQLKIQVSTLEAMNNDLTTQLKKEKNDRRMLDGIIKTNDIFTLDYYLNVDFFNSSLTYFQSTLEMP